MTKSSVVDEIPLAMALRAALALAMAPAIGLGIARFGYALVLPDMQASLGWTYAQAGWMNTVNAIGYLLGALASASLLARFRAWPCVFAGALAATIAVLASAATANFALLSAIRLIAGIAAAVAFVGGGTLAAGLSQAADRNGALVLSVFYVGPGLGIALSGATTPLLLDRLGPGSWWIAWAWLGLLCIPLLAGLAARAAPAGEPPVGKAAAPLGPMLPLLAAYGLFGAGYIAYMTFMVAWIRENGGGAVAQGAFWSAIGLGALAWPWLWSGLLERLAGGRAFAALTGITSFAAALPMLAGGPVALLASGTVFGASFFAVVAATTVFIRRYQPRQAWGSGVAAMTVAFSIGQAVGPLGTGFLSDAMGGLDAGLGLSAALLALAAALALAQGEVPSRSA